MNTADLNAYFIDCLEGKIEHYSSLDVKPFELVLNMTGLKRFRIYAYNAGCPPGGRPAGEYKIVLTVNQPAGTRGNFDRSGNYLVLVVGYVTEYDVFVLWDADKHVDFAFNKNLQVKFETIMQAFMDGMAFQDRNTLRGKETVIAAHKTYLTKAIHKRLDILINELLED